MQHNISPMLPPGVVSKILQLVPEKSRLSSCALVCHAWHSAAVTASSCITAQLPQQAQLDSMGVWLQRQGAVLQALSVTGGCYGVRYIWIPFEQLQHLKAWKLKDVEVLESSTTSSRTSSPTESTSLQLNRIRWRGIHALTQLTNLRQLQLNCVTSYDKVKRHEPVNDSLQRALGVCTQLTSLTIDWDYLRSSFGGTADCMVGRLGSLTHLQQLQVKGQSWEADMDLLRDMVKSLPWGLTHLRLQWRDACDEPPQLAASTTPRITELTCLRHLAVSGNCCVRFDPQLLHSLLQLQHLGLKQCRMKSDVGVLLAAISRLKHLQHLCLYGSMDCVTNGEQYTALVSSSQLTFLDLTDCSMPDNAVHCIFIAQQQCPTLKTFIIGREIHDRQRDERESVWTLCSGALGRLVCSCPALQELQLLGIKQLDYEALTAMKDITDLSKLRLASSGVSNDDLRTLVELGLPALRDLEVVTVDAERDTTVTAEGAWCLRQMTQLTRLVLGEWGRDAKYNYKSKFDWQVEFKSEDGLSDLRERMIDNYQHCDNYQLKITPNALLLLDQQQQDCAEAIRRAETAEQQVQELQHRLACQEFELLRRFGNI